MAAEHIVRSCVHVGFGDEPTNPSGAGGESPSIFPYLSDRQISAVAMFYWVHSTCGPLDVENFWLDDLQTVEEIRVHCPICSITRTFDRYGKGVNNHD